MFQQQENCCHHYLENSGSGRIIDFRSDEKTCDNVAE